MTYLANLIKHAKPSNKFMRDIRNLPKGKKTDVINERCLETVFLDSPVDSSIARMIDA